MTKPNTPQIDPHGRLFLPAGDVELSALRGYCAANSQSIKLNVAPLYVYSRATNPTRRVGLVAGGGSGHEPMHAGIVGAGGLDAAVPGRIFASPHNRQIYEASRRVAGRDGVLHIVKNYTGDRIHFGIAAERLTEEGIPVAQVLVDDDLATDAKDTGTGRRGTGATIVVEKILGAFADTGANLQELKDYGDQVVADSRSLAVASGPLTSFATMRPAFDIASGTIEYGIGIHGEPAPETIINPQFGDLIARMVDELVASLPKDTDRVIALVNGLGAVTAIELGAVMHAVEQELAVRAVVIDSALVGTFVSALDMRGFLLTFTRTDDERTSLWLRAATLPGLPSTSRYVPADDLDEVIAAEVGDAADAFLTTIERLARRAHPVLTHLDQLAGDGDFGDNFMSGIEQVRRVDGRRPGMERLAKSFLDHVGGSSGPLIGLLLSAMLDETVDSATAGRAGIARGLKQGVQIGMNAIQRAGGAQPGDRTMLDALAGAVAVTSDDPVSVVRGAAAGAMKTAQMHARQGRASYVGDRVLGAPDAGAVGTTLLLAAIGGSLDNARRTEYDAVAEELLEWIGDAPRQ